MRKSKRTIVLLWALLLFGFTVYAPSLLFSDRLFVFIQETIRFVSRDLVDSLHVLVHLH